jgi:hypothetical protein
MNEREKKEDGVLSDRLNELEPRAFVNNRYGMYRRKKIF